MEMTAPIISAFLRNYLGEKEHEGQDGNVCLLSESLLS